MSFERGKFLNEFVPGLIMNILDNPCIVKELGWSEDKVDRFLNMIIEDMSGAVPKDKKRKK